MANRRMLSRDIATSVRVNKLNDFDALLYTWIIPFLDDFGRFDGNPEVIRATIFPMRKATDKRIARSLAKMADINLILWYAEFRENPRNSGNVCEYDFKLVLSLEPDKFEAFQTNLHKRTKSKYPEPSDQAIFLTSENFLEFLGNPRNSALIELNRTELNRREGKGTEQKACNDAPEENNKNIVHKRIFDHWNSKGIKKHREFEKFKPTINARLREYSESEIVEAIDNYHAILTGKEYFWSYKWALDDFLKPDNLDNFLTENDPFTNYKSRGGNKNSGNSPPVKATPLDTLSEMYQEALNEQG